MQMIRTIFPMLACAFLLEAGVAQDLDLITLEGHKQMLADPGTNPVGARQPDVMIVEYFDYNCPYCKTLVPVLRELLAQDPRVAVLYKEWPILGAVSTYAASSALAARWQGKYLAAHDALMSGPRLAQDSQIDAMLEGAGLNMDVLKRDRTTHAKEIAALLARNDAEAHALTLDGTPGLVVGLQLVPGVANLTFLKQLVAKSRQGMIGRPASGHHM
ncbi:MAG: DsbA family protein [Steroidobacteraceae bacterium]